MSGDDDRPSWTDREKKSFSELDRMRREGRSGERANRSERDRVRADAESKRYLKQVDTLFSKGRGGGEGERLARAMRDAHGTPGLADACRAYGDALGAPEHPSELALFLDSGDTELVVAALAALLALRRAGKLDPSAGLTAQIRMLSQGSDDAIAEAAEDLLGAL